MCTVTVSQQHLYSGAVHAVSESVAFGRKSPISARCVAVVTFPSMTFRSSRKHSDGAPGRKGHWPS